MARYRQFRKVYSRAVRVLVDMDCVLCDFEGHFLQKYREKFPDSPYVPLDERKTFYISDQYKTFGPDVVADTQSITEAKGFFRDMPPIPGAVDALKEMSSLDNVEVFICTSQLTASSYCAQEKFEWIGDHLGQDWRNRVIMTKDKTIIGGDLLFDDKAKIRGLEKEPSWDQILFTAYHNKHLDITKLQAKSRLDSWEDKEQWLQSIEDCRKKLS